MDIIFTTVITATSEHEVCSKLRFLAPCRLCYYGIWYYKTQTSCFLFPYWLGHEQQHLSYCTDDSYRNVAADFRSKLWNRPHKDSWTAASQNYNVSLFLTGIRGPINNVPRLCAQDCRAVKHSSATGSKRHGEQEKKTENTVFNVIIISPHFCFYCT